MPSSAMLCTRAQTAAATTMARPIKARPAPSRLCTGSRSFALRPRCRTRWPSVPATPRQIAPIRPNRATVRAISRFREGGEAFRAGALLPFPPRLLAAGRLADLPRPVVLPRDWLPDLAAVLPPDLAPLERVAPLLVLPEPPRPAPPDFAPPPDRVPPELRRAPPPLALPGGGVGSITSGDSSL